jgi:hypothetical protein
MPSNKELIEAIAAVSPETDVSGMSNAQMTEKLKELRTEPAEPAPAEPAPAEPAPAEPAAAEYTVAPGKAITSKKGILSGDTADEVTADMLAGGDEAIKSFVKSGHIIENKG